MYIYYNVVFKVVIRVDNLYSICGRILHWPKLKTNQVPPFSPISTFLPARRYVSVAFCLCLSHAGIVSKRLNGPRSLLAQRLPSAYATVYFKEIWVSPKMRTLLLDFSLNSGL